MKSIKLSLIAALLATTGVVSNLSASDLELSANVAMTNNYVWRGMTQSDDKMAIQGGFDAGYKGLYAGVWSSNVDFDDPKTSIETDVYFGYGSEIKGLSYDIGYCLYTYPGDHENLDFSEISLSLGYDFKVASISAKYYEGLSDAPSGYELGGSIPLPKEISLDVAYGDYDTYGAYYSAGLSKSFGKHDVSLSYTGVTADDVTNNTTDQDNVVLAVGTSF